MAADVVPKDPAAAGTDARRTRDGIRNAHMSIAVPLAAD